MLNYWPADLLSQPLYLAAQYCPGVIPILMGVLQTRLLDRPLDAYHIQLIPLVAEQLLCSENLKISPESVGLFIRMLPEYALENLFNHKNEAGLTVLEETMKNHPMALLVLLNAMKEMPHLTTGVMIKKTGCLLEHYKKPLTTEAFELDFRFQLLKLKYAVAEEENQAPFRVSRLTPHVKAIETAFEDYLTAANKKDTFESLKTAIQSVPKCLLKQSTLNTVLNIALCFTGIYLCVVLGENLYAYIDKTPDHRFFPTIIPSDNQRIMRYLKENMAGLFQEEDLAFETHKRAPQGFSLDPRSP